MEGKKVPGRSRTMMLDWMKNKDRGYKEVKEKAKNREEWYHWNPGPDWKGREPKKNYHVIPILIYNTVFDYFDTYINY